jgi:hypothetical protein
MSRRFRKLATRHFNQRGPGLARRAAWPLLTVGALLVPLCAGDGVARAATGSDPAAWQQPSVAGASVASGASTNLTVTSCATDAQLRAAVSAAVAAGAGTVGFNCAGTGPFTITLSAPLPVSNGAVVTIDGSDAGRHDLTLDGAHRVRAFEVLGSNSSLTLNNVKEQDGGGVRQGAGAYVQRGASLILQGSSFSNNAAVGPDGAGGSPGAAGGDGGDAQGGAVYNLGSLALTRSILRANAAGGGNGGNGGNAPSDAALSGNGGNGGAARGGAIYNLGSMTLTQSTLSGNAASGGAAGNGGDGPQDTPDSSHGGNGGKGGDALGGAIYAPGSLALTQSTLSSNTASGGAGGSGGFGEFGDAGVGGNGGVAKGGALESTGSISMATSALSLNTATGGDAGSAGLCEHCGFIPDGMGGDALGGAVHTGGQASIVAGTLNGNSAAGGIDPDQLGNGGDGSARGGAIANEGTLTLTNATITGNSASARNTLFIDFPGTATGGGISNGGSLTLISDTLSANSAAGGAVGPNDGGDLLVGGTGIVVANTILSAGTPDECSAALGSSDHSYNLEYGNGTARNTCGLSTTPPSNDRLGNPLLGNLASNGGPTQTMALGPLSDAINRIPPAACVDAQGHPLTADQRGLPRPFPAGGLCDIGAYEYQAIPSYAVAFAQGWSLISLPLTPTGPISASTVLAGVLQSSGGSLAAIYPLQAGRWSAPLIQHANSAPIGTDFPLLPGQGYLLYTDVGGSYTPTAASTAAGGPLPGSSGGLPVPGSGQQPPPPGLPSS